jgi:hypothetical protein
VVRWTQAGICPWSVGLRLVGLGLRAGGYYEAVRHLSIDLRVDLHEEALAVRQLLIGLGLGGARSAAAAVRPGSLALRVERHNGAAVWHSLAGFVRRSSVLGSRALAVG